MAIWRKVHEFKAGGHSRLKAVGHKVNGSVEVCVAKPKYITSEHATRRGTRGRRGWLDVVATRIPRFNLGREVLRVARLDRVAHISKQSQIESVLVLSISFG